jgi:hypothetical protein
MSHYQNAKCAPAEQGSIRNTEGQNPMNPAHPDQWPNKDASSYLPFSLPNAFKELNAAVEVMQTEFFSLWLGKWTTAIDWTAAVMGTHLSATLSSFSRSLSYTMPGTFDRTRKLDVDAQMMENEINKYFGQSVAYYFGEEYFSIRNQAYDDMLWVVLGWLESIQFIAAHAERHYSANGDAADGRSAWHAQQFVPAFAHRARVFYKLAEQGWDWRLCGGGMTWNPRLLPYKNAITNELFVSASVAMYLHFPGDSNCSPFMAAEAEHLDWEMLRAEETGDARACLKRQSSTYDPDYLANAIDGYDWLANSGMTNEQGLYVDGFHIKDYARNHSNVECNERNEMVYTYNQGVVLSGLRGLWEATGNTTYLEDGHELIRNVILATGFQTTDISPADTFTSRTVSKRRENTSFGPTETWAGLGTHGILTELCDPYGTCTQDGQTFKGIFFHHLTAFCKSLPTTPVQPGKTYAASKFIARLHHSSCTKYTPWVIHNAQAALGTRDRKGRFGMWWGADPDTNVATSVEQQDQLLLARAVDYRNAPTLLTRFVSDEEMEQDDSEMPIHDDRQPRTQGDLNDRGRGRTVETQGGGVAVVRATWEFLKMESDGAFDA